MSTRSRRGALLVLMMLWMHGLRMAAHTWGDDETTPTATMVPAGGYLIDSAARKVDSGDLELQYWYWYQYVVEIAFCFAFVVGAFVVGVPFASCCNCSAFRCSISS